MIDMRSKRLWLVVPMVALILVVADLLRGRAAIDEHSFERFTSGRFLDRDILDSLCSFPYDGNCVFGTNRATDTVVISMLDGEELLWWRLSSVTVHDAQWIRPVTTPSGDPKPDYIANSPMGTQDWSLGRVLRPKPVHASQIWADSIGEAVFGPGRQLVFPFRSQSIELQDVAGNLVAALHSKRTVRGTVRLEQREGTMALMVTYLALNGADRAK